MNAAAQVQRLPVNCPPERAFTGGDRIAEFRHAAPGTTGPEDWIASTVTPFDNPSIGLTILNDGTSLAEHLRDDPHHWLGPEHAARWGADPGILVKLLDVRQRLRVHFHPTRDFASRHLASCHGKTEAWLALQPTTAYLGLRHDISRDTLDALVAEQDWFEFRDALHRIDLGPGDAVTVPAGTAHSLEAGAFVLEVQEPTDFSIRLEWPEGTSASTTRNHLGLGLDRALSLLDRTVLSPDRLAELIVRDTLGADRVDLFPAAREVFACTARRLRPGRPTEIGVGYAIVIAVAGTGRLHTAATSAAVDVGAGDAVLVPWSAGAVNAEGDLTLVVCRPPAVPDH